MHRSHSGTAAAARPDDADVSDHVRRRRATFRAWHRGTREMDLVMGRFADREIGDMGEADLAIFERLLDLPDADVFAWVTGRVEAPADLAAFVARLGVHRGAA